MTLQAPLTLAERSGYEYNSDLSQPVAVMSIEEILRRAQVTELILSPCVCVPRLTPLGQVLERMRQERLGCVVVCEADRVVGIFTDRDVLMKVVGVDVDRASPIEAFMTPDPTIVHSGDRVWEAMRLMDEGGYRNLPLVDDNGRCRGIVSVGSIIDFLAAHFPTEVYNLPPRADQTFAAPDGA